jgi:uncharacterized repeat protein (TIGR03803 family)
MAMTRRTLVTGAMFALAAFGTRPAHAQTYTVLHRFSGSDGSLPLAGLIADPAGNLFGTTGSGGGFGNGTIFKVGATGLTVLYSGRTAESPVQG